MKKTCNKCEGEQDISQFNWRNKKKGTFCSNCKTCQKEYSHQHYLSNKNNYKQRANIRNRHNRKVVAKYVYEYLTQHPCLDCGEENIIVLQFDHVRRTKRKTIATMIKHSYSIKTIQTEIDKCEIRCSNCHIIRHAKENGNTRYEFQKARIV